MDFKDNHIHFMSPGGKPLTFAQLLKTYARSITWWTAVVVAPLALIVYFTAVSYKVRVTKRQKFTFTTQLVRPNSGPSTSSLLADSSVADNKEVNDISWYATHPYTGFQSPANVHGRITKSQDFNKEYYFNALGHRSPDLPPKSPNVLRIAMTGGSTAFAGSSNEKTVVAQLAKLIESRTGRNVEYINAAIVSGSTTQEVAMVAQSVIDIEPDILISYNGYNDIVNFLQTNGRIGWPATEFTNYYPKVRPVTNPSLEQLDALVANYARNMRELTALSHEFGIKFVAILHPYRSFSKAYFNEEEARQDPTTYYYWRIMEAYSRWDLEPSMTGRFISFLGKLEGSAYFIDEVHINDDGNKVVAEMIADALVKLGFI